MGANSVGRIEGGDELGKHAVKWLRSHSKTFRKNLPRPLYNNLHSNQLLFISAIQERVDRP